MRGNEEKERAFDIEIESLGNELAELDLEYSNAVARLTAQIDPLVIKKEKLKEQRLQIQETLKKLREAKEERRQAWSTLSVSRSTVSMAREMSHKMRVKARKELKK